MKKILILALLFTLAFSYCPKAISPEKATLEMEKKMNWIKKQKIGNKKNLYQPGTILVTPDKFKDVLPLGHAAIVKDSNVIIEAVKRGVVKGKNNWDDPMKGKKRFVGLKVKNLNETQLKKAVKYAEKQVGKPYNKNFFNSKTKKKFYCSQLVWAAFYDTLKINLDSEVFGLADNKKVAAIHPIELALSPHTKTVYYYAK